MKDEFYYTISTNNDLLIDDIITIFLNKYKITNTAVSRPMLITNEYIKIDFEVRAYNKYHLNNFYIFDRGGSILPVHFYFNIKENKPELIGFQSNYKIIDENFWNYIYNCFGKSKNYNKMIKELIKKVL